MTQEEDRIRTIAGYLLKNNSRLILGSPPEVAQYVKAAVLQAFNDPSIIVRNAASQDIVAFLGVLEPKNWPECLQQLVNALDSNDIDRQEVSVLCHRWWHTRWVLVWREVWLHMSLV
jgi:transportin-1